MKWFIDTIVKPWHPTLLGLVVISSIVYFVLVSGYLASGVSQELTREMCQGIQPGMTLEEVIALLPKPGEVIIPSQRSADCDFLVVWKSSKFEFFVTFDENQNVAKFSIQKYSCMIEPR